VKEFALEALNIKITELQLVAENNRVNSFYSLEDIYIAEKTHFQRGTPPPPDFQLLNVCGDSIFLSNNCLCARLLPKRPRH